jgi:hypothetical protein
VTRSLSARCKRGSKKAPLRFASRSSPSRGILLRSFATLLLVCTALLRGLASGASEAAEKVRVFGIELLDIWFKRINYNESVLRAVSYIGDANSCLRDLIFPEEDRHLFTTTPWQGGYRWFRSPNVVPIEQWRCMSSAASGYARTIFDRCACRCSAVSVQSALPANRSVLPAQKPGRRLARTLLLEGSETSFRTGSAQTN